MNRESYLTLLLAVCCIAAAGVSATTLDSTISQTPDDVIDVDFAKLPIGADQGESVKGAIQNDEKSQTSTGSGGNDQSENAGSDGSNGDDSSNSADPSRSRNEKAQAGNTDSGSASGGNEGSGNSGGGGAGAGVGSGVEELSLLEWLLALLRKLLPLLVVLVALGLAYRYRYHLLALGVAVVSVLRGDGDDRTVSATEWPSEQPSNEIHRAWLSMVAETDIEEPRTRTPSECAAAAVDANLDPSAVRTLTDVFEEVRYGEKPVTDERRERARKGLERLRGRGGETL